MPQLLILSSEYPPGPGGIGTHAYQLSHQLHRLGWELVVLAPQNYVTHAEKDAFNRGQPFPIMTLDRQRFVLSKLLYRWRIAAQQVATTPAPDVLLATGERMVWLSALLALRYRFPWLAVGHGNEFGSKTPLRRTITHWAFEQASMVITVSRYTQERMLSRGISPRRYEVIPNGADDIHFQSIDADALDDFRREHDLLDKRLIITVGNVSERKGQDIVIRALPAILHQIPDMHYLLIGLPTKQAEYQQIARALGVEDYVHFLGRVDQEQLPYYLAASDVFVMTSRHDQRGSFEGYGIAVVEAALCGTPAVVAENSGLAEAVDHEQTGLVVPPEDPGAVSSAIIRLLQDEPLLQRLSQQAQQRGRTQTWTHQAQYYHHALKSILVG